MCVCYLFIYYLFIRISKDVGLEIKNLTIPIYFFFLHFPGPFISRFDSWKTFFGMKS